jgi:hypothetical protein
MADLKAADRIFDVDPRGGARPDRSDGRSGNLKERLASRKAALAGAWLDRAVRAYPAETAALLRREGDPFGNPVGHALTVGIRGLVDGLLSGADAGELGACLEPILKIRSVQGLPASQALAFIFELKEVIREELPDALQTAGLAGECFELDAQIDRLALLAFDLFTQWRERAHEIRVREIKRQVSGHLRRLELAEADGAAADTE